jgi:hypothetical protein
VLIGESLGGDGVVVTLSLRLIIFNESHLILADVLMSTDHQEGWGEEVS